MKEESGDHLQPVVLIGDTVMPTPAGECVEAYLDLSERGR